MVQIPKPGLPRWEFPWQSKGGVQEKFWRKPLVSVDGCRVSGRISWAVQFPGWHHTVHVTRGCCIESWETNLGTTTMCHASKRKLENMMHVRMNAMYHVPCAVGVRMGSEGQMARIIRRLEQNKEEKPILRNFGPTCVFCWGDPCFLVVLKGNPKATWTPWGGPLQKETQLSAPRRSRPGEAPHSRAPSLPGGCSWQTSLASRSSEVRQVCGS